MTLVNIHEPEYTKQILMDVNRDTESNTVIAGDFNTPLISMVDLLDRKSTRKQGP